MNLLHDWPNGNVTVKIFDDGTKIREYEGTPDPEYPETIDMKITNWCDAPCQKWCHEQSNVKGLHADAQALQDVLHSAHAGMEIAFGGGATQTYPGLMAKVWTLNSRGVIANMTVNQHHIASVSSLALMQFCGIGLSYQAHMPKDLIVETYFRHPHVVVHLIMGVHSPDDLRAIENVLQAKGMKGRYLLLGYKNWGNGKRYKSVNDLAIDKCLRLWYIAMGELVKKHHIGFDNLAIEQMKLSRLFTDEGWKKFYMGDEGTFSMYIDMVKQEYASHSTSPDRYPVNGQGIKKMFQHIRQLAKKEGVI